MLLFCFVCASTNALTIGIAQQANPPAPVVPVIVQVTATPPQEVTLLQQQVDSLQVKVQSLRAEALTPLPPAATATPIPPPPKSIAMAAEGHVNLRAGPGEEYNRLGRLLLGDSVEIVGRNPDSTWWLVVTHNGQFAWVADMAVATFNIQDTLPVVSIPVLLVQLPGAQQAVAAAPAPPAAEITPAPALPTSTAPSVNITQPRGTPTVEAQASRRFVQDTLGYKQLIRRLLLPTVSESFAPHGERIAITEKIKLYTITTDGSTSRILLEDDDTINLIGDVVWSPDELYLAFVADRRRDCDPCRTVGLARLGDGKISYLKFPPDAGADRPRWTQDGKLLVTIFWDTVENGTVYEYDTVGLGQEAAGSYILSSSHNGQKWFPWLPGKVWQADSQQTDSYYSD
jgi:hypothetical protein